MKETNMDNWMTFDEAWDEFFSGRGTQPSPEDKMRSHEIAACLGCEKFKITKNYMRDASNVLHVNSGFLVAKSEAPYMTTDSVYEEEGFTHRLKFTNAGATTIAKKESVAPGRPYCGLCSSQDHMTIECPDHPDNGA